MEPVVSVPDQLEIIPLQRPVDAAVTVPGSKSITNRALVLAALTYPDEGCVLHGALRSEDTEVMIDSLLRLGFIVNCDWANSTLFVHREPSPTRIPAPQAELFVSNSGTSMRFLTAMVSLGHGQYRIDGTPRMRERPVDDLLGALRQLGVTARSEMGNGCPPVVIKAQGLRGGDVHVRGEISSQFLSALLMVAPFAQAPVQIYVDGPLVSRPYVEMTVEMMRGWGLKVERPLEHVYRVPGGGGYEISGYHIEPDATAASYFFAAAAITGGRITVLGFPEESLQGDLQFADYMETMGCRVEHCTSGITVHGRPLRGVDVDMNDISDTVMTLAAVACFAEGPTTIRNVAHIRHKETDRLAALAAELRRVGAEVEEFSDGLKITPRPLHGAEIETYNDHRMAMSMALIGLRVPGIVIKNPACVAKTYPDFFDDLEKLRRETSS